MEKNENLTAKAQAYAQEVLKEQLDAVANAYIKGYNDGMGDQPKFQESVTDGYDTFVDLGLESGTLWTDRPHCSINGIIGLGYYDALKYGIPTREQFEEMQKKCVQKNKISFRGPSSKQITFDFGRAELYRAWVKSDVVDDKALAFYVRDDGSCGFERTFVGHWLCFMRVKNKNEEKER